MIRFDQLYHGWWPAGGGAWHVLLDHVDWSMASGDRVAIIMRPGSGKSSLLQLIGGQVQPVAGWLDRRDCHCWPVTLGHRLQRRMGLADNLLILAGLAGLDPSAFADWVIDFGVLGAFADVAVVDLPSSVQVQLNWAVAMAMPVDLLLIDNGLSGVAADFRAKLELALGERPDLGMILATSQPRQAALLARKSYWLDEGSLHPLVDPMEAEALITSNVDPISLQLSHSFAQI